MLEVPFTMGSIEVVVGSISSMQMEQQYVILRSQISVRLFYYRNLLFTRHSMKHATAQAG